MTETIPTPTDRFQSRDEIVAFIEQQTTTALDKALATTPPTAKVERRVPWVTSGPVGRDSEGYSVLKAAAFALGYIGPDQAKEELHTHYQLRDLYQTYGFVPHCGHQSFLVPIATQHLPAFEPRGARLRDEIRQKMLAHADRFDPDEGHWLQRRLGLRTKALGTLSDVAGGSFVGFPLLGEIIDLQRNMEAFATAGAQEIALPPNGRLQFPKLSGGSTAYWVGEGSAITESEPTTGNLDLQAKKLGIFVKMNNELLRFASPSAEGLVRFDMARVAALKADLAMLEGTGGTQIKGLLTYSGLTTHTASTVGTNGNTFEAQDVALMEGKLPDAVDTPTAWLMRKTMFAALMNRRADAISANDQKGAFLFHPSRNPADAPPTELYGTKVVRSSQISNTRTKGSATNLTYIVLGFFPDWIVARLGVMEVPGQRFRRYGPAKRSNVPARYPAHRRWPTQPRQLCAVRSISRRLTRCLVFGPTFATDSVLNFAHDDRPLPTTSIHLGVSTMSTHIDDFKNEVLLQASVYPSEVDDSGNGATVDMVDADGRCFAVQIIGTVGGTTPSLTGKIQESVDGSTWTDVSNASFTAVTASNNQQVLVFERTKRYLRHTRTVSGTSPTFVLNALVGEVKKVV